MRARFVPKFLPKSNEALYWEIIKAIEQEQFLTVPLVQILTTLDEVTRDIRDVAHDQES